MSKKISLLLFTGLVLLPGCIRVPSYSRKPLASVSDNSTYRKVKQNIIVQAKRLTENNIQYLFGTHCQQNDNSLEAIYLSVCNLNDATYQLSSSDIGCNMLSYKEVIKRMKTSSVIRLASTMVSIGTTYSAFYIFAYGACMIVPIITYTGLSLGIIGFGLGLACMGSGIKSIVMNTRIKKDIKEKMIPKQVIIKSGDHYEGLIFVKSSDYKAKFNVVISDTNNHHNKITFEVDLQQV